MKKDVVKQWVCGLCCGLLVPVFPFSQTAPVQDAHFVRGIQLQQAGKLEEAISEYELSAKARPSYPVLANLGAAYARLGRYEEAIVRYRQALQLAPGSPEITLNLGLAHYKSGNIQQAVTLFEDVQKADPTSLQAQLLAADCYFQLGEYRKVIEKLEPIEPSHSSDLSIAYLLGTAYLRDKQTEKGQRLVDRILRDGDSAEAHLMIGTAFAEINENKAFITEFERSLQSNSKLPMAHSSLGQALLRSGDRERALSLFDEELKINPNDFTANFYAGFLRRRNNQDAQALPYLQRALELRPSSDQAAFQVSLIYIQSGELDKAQQILEDLVARFPEFIDAHITLARIYYRRKMKARGDQEQEAAERLRMERQKREQGSQKSAELNGDGITGRELEPLRPQP